MQYDITPASFGSRTGLCLSSIFVAALAFSAAGCSRNQAPTGSASSAGTAAESVGHATQALTATNRAMRIKRTGRCLDLTDGNSADTTQYQSWACALNDNQRFTITPVGAYHTISNATSGKCLAVAATAPTCTTDEDCSAAGVGGVCTNGSCVGRPLQQATCNAADDKQLWTIDQAMDSYNIAYGTGEYEIANKSTGQCMDLTDGVNDDGAHMQTWNCNHGHNNDGSINDNQRLYAPSFVQDFEDQFTGSGLNTANWQDQLDAVTGEQQSNVGWNAANCGVTSFGGSSMSLKLRPTPSGCSASSSYVAARLSTKSKKEYSQGKWTIKMRLSATNGLGASGQAGMAPNFGLIGNAYPTTCWSQPGAKALTLFRHDGVAYRIISKQFFAQSNGSTPGAADTANPPDAASNPNCVDITGGSLTNGTAAQHWECNGNSQQSYVVSDRGNGTWELKRSGTNKCIDRDNAGNGRVQQWDCAGPGNSNQGWYLNAKDDGYYEVVSQANSQCLNAWNGNLDVEACNGTDAQRFKFESGTSRGASFSTADQYSAGPVVAGTDCADGDPWSRVMMSGATLGNFYEYGLEIVGNNMYFTRRDCASQVADGSDCTVNNVFIGHRQMASDYTENMFAVLGYGKTSADTMTGDWTVEVDYVRHASLQ